MINFWEFAQRNARDEFEPTDTARDLLEAERIEAAARVPMSEAIGRRYLRSLAVKGERDIPQTVCNCASPTARPQYGLPTRLLICSQCGLLMRLRPDPAPEAQS